MKSKQEVIEILLQRIRAKKGPKALAIIAPKKPAGVKMIGRRVIPSPKPKPVAVAPTPKPKPKYPPLKLVAISNQDKAKIDRLLKSDPVSAFAMGQKLYSKVNAANKKIVAWNNLTDIEKDREAQRKELVKKASETLTASLMPVRDLKLDPNWKASVLLSHITKAAFQSSLVNDVLWVSTSIGGVSVKVGAQTIGVADYKDLLEAAAKKLYTWSGMGKSLNNEKNEEPTVWNLIWGLSEAASMYKAEQARLKPSEYYLGKLVEQAIAAPLLYTKATAKRTEVLAALALATAEQAIALGFRVDKSKTVHINSSDSRFGETELSDKILLPYIQSIIDGSVVAGRLKSTGDASNLLTVVKNLLPL